MYVLYPKSFVIYAYCCSRKTTSMDGSLPKIYMTIFFKKNTSLFFNI